MKRCLGLMLLGCVAAMQAQSGGAGKKSLIRDVVQVEGVRENPLLGYGMVVGLAGTGDKQQTLFTTQTLASILSRMGVQIPAGAVKVRNVAAVFVTASLPAFARPGTQLDVTVSSMGDAKSIEGGLLLLTPLYGADGQVYGAAQGPVAVGGYSVGGSGNSKQLNHPTVGRIPSGGLVERGLNLDLEQQPLLTLLLRDPDYGTAEEVARTINLALGSGVARARDGRRIELTRAAVNAGANALLARIEALPVEVHRRAKVVVNERTGTVVLGRDVKLGAVSILHGSFSVEISTELQVSQPEPFSRGETTVVPQTSVAAAEAKARKVELGEGASVEQLVSGLQSMGATARDVISILQAIKAAGALEADLEVI